MPIRKVGNKFKIDRVAGLSPTLKAAKARLRAIKASENVRRPKSVKMSKARLRAVKAAEAAERRIRAAEKKKRAKKSK